MDELLARIDNLLHPLNSKRLDYLMDCDEFRAARHKLMCMKEKVERGCVLTPYQLTYLTFVEDHIKNIQPHIEILTVNGEEREVLFLTRVTA